MTDSSGSQDIISYEKQSDLEDRNNSMDADFESSQTTSDAVPLSPFQEGGWRAWSVVLGVYVSCLPIVSIYRIIEIADGSPNFAPLGMFSCSSLGNFMTSQCQDIQTHLGCTTVSSRNIIWLVKPIFGEQIFMFEPIWRLPALPRRSGI